MSANTGHEYIDKMEAQCSLKITFTTKGALFFFSRLCLHGHYHKALKRPYKAEPFTKY